MFVFPLKWLPWLLLIGGIILIFSGEANTWTVLITIGGGVWAFFQVTGKKNQSVSTKNNTQGIHSQNSVANGSSSQGMAGAASTVRKPANQCPNCGNIENNTMQYCTKCGTKL